MNITVDQDDYTSIEAYADDRHSESLKLTFGDIDIFISKEMSTMLGALLVAAFHKRGTAYFLMKPDGQGQVAKVVDASECKTFYDLVSPGEILYPTGIVA